MYYHSVKSEIWLRSKAGAHELVWTDERIIPWHCYYVVDSCVKSVAVLHVSLGHILSRSQPFNIPQPIWTRMHDARPKGGARQRKSSAHGLASCMHIGDLKSNYFRYVTLSMSQATDTGSVLQEYEITRTCTPQSHGRRDSTGHKLKGENISVLLQLPAQLSLCSCNSIHGNILENNHVRYLYC